MAGEPWTPADEARHKEAVRKRALDRRWEDLQKITWEDVMGLREKLIYGLLLAVACAFAVMVVMLVAVLR
ncbi:MAG: hypothetical protein QXO51_01835 [Halobacteria archaeon]